MDQNNERRGTPGRPRRTLHIAVERGCLPPRPWLWVIRSDEGAVAVSPEGFAGAEEAWEAARPELLKRTPAAEGMPLVRPRRL